MPLKSACLWTPFQVLFLAMCTLGCPGRDGPAADGAADTREISKFKAQHVRACLCCAFATQHSHWEVLSVAKGSWEGRVWIAAQVHAILFSPEVRVCKPGTVLFNTAAAAVSSHFHGEEIHPGTPAGNVKPPPCFIAPSGTAQPRFEMGSSFSIVCISPSLSPAALCWVCHPPSCCNF